MIEIPDDEAGTLFESLIDRAIQDEVIMITREGRPIARLSPIRRRVTWTRRYPEIT
jgi:prevent-host-death family protein